MLLKRAHINKVKVIRKYMSSTLTEIFTSQKTLGQCTVQIFAKSWNKWGKKPKVRASTLPLVWNSRKRAWKSAGVIQMFSNQSNVTLSFSGNENYNAPLISQGLEEYSRDLGVKRNTVRYSGKRKIACRVKSLTGKRDSQKTLVRNAVLGKKTLFGIGMTEVRDQERFDGIRYLSVSLWYHI